MCAPTFDIDIAPVGVMGESGVTTIIGKDQCLKKGDTVVKLQKHKVEI